MEQLAQSTETGHHLVHFYATEDDLARTVGGYLREAVTNGASAVVIATEPHRRALAGEVPAAGLVRYLDARETLDQLMPAGQLDREVFQELIGGVIRSAGEGGRQVCAYGEMVALLWDAGDVPGAIELEMLWNELAEQVPFSLLCGYPSASVAGPEHAEALHQVCCLHTAELRTRRAGARFPASPDSPGAARRFLRETLRVWGQKGTTGQDATLVVSELATNSVVHAVAPFSLLVWTDGSSLRIEVSDSSRRQPVERTQPLEAPSGRGLNVVATVARTWGVRNTPDGKTVWAELALSH